MPMVKQPTSRYLNVAEWKEILKKAKTEQQKICIIVTAPIEPEGREEMLTFSVANEVLGEKIIYDFKNKFRAFFDSYTEQTDCWIGKYLKPVPPDNNSLFFVGYEPVDFTEEKIN